LGLAFSCECALNCLRLGLHTCTNQTPLQSPVGWQDGSVELVAARMDGEAELKCAAAQSSRRCILFAPVHRPIVYLIIKRTRAPSTDTFILDGTRHQIESGCTAELLLKKCQLSQCQFIMFYQRRSFVLVNSDFISPHV